MAFSTILQTLIKQLDDLEAKFQDKNQYDPTRMDSISRFYMEFLPIYAQAKLISELIDHGEITDSPEWTPFQAFRPSQEELAANKPQVLIFLNKARVLADKTDADTQRLTPSSTDRFKAFTQYFISKMVPQAPVVPSPPPSQADDKGISFMKKKGFFLN